MRLYLLLIGLISSGICQLNYNESYHIQIKYIPFSTKTHLALSENQLNNLKETIYGLQVIETNIESDSITKRIMQEIASLKITDTESEIHYNLRMQCKIYNGETLIDSFFIDDKNRVVYSGKAYNNTDSLVDVLIMDNLCRPLVSYFLLNESLFWNDDMEGCEDSVGFIKAYGKNRFDETDWKEKKKLSKDFKKMMRH